MSGPLDKHHQFYKLLLIFRFETVDDFICYSPDPALSSEETSSQKEYKFRDLFLQKENCFSTAHYLPQCRECENDPMVSKYICRFYEFRKIERDNGTCKVAESGFLDGHLDPTREDIELWSKSDKKLETDSESTDYILNCIASQFCEMTDEEINIARNLKSGEVISWKRSVLQVREMCDVCETSLFNFHWTCRDCGTCICIDCFKERQKGFIRWKLIKKVDKEERDQFFWYKCATGKQDHDLMLTQMTTEDTLFFLNEKLHKVSEQRGITQKCGCSLRTKSCLLMESKNILLEGEQQPQPNQSYFALRKMIKKQRHKKKLSMVRRLSLTESNQIYPRIKHRWICQGRILKLLEPLETDDSYKIFQDQWEHGKPLIIGNVTRKMNRKIWLPSYFSAHFGNDKHILIDCKKSTAISRVPMKYFWDGFQSIAKRLPREGTDKLVLKLKDWPTSDDFADILKEHFKDFMNNLPMCAYTRRDGKFNLARYLPDHFSRPDLGPKMYSAYSQGYPANNGSTNLHLDVSDAINVMVYVSKPHDAHLSPNQYSTEKIRVALDHAGADEIDKQRCNKLPGAVWHIYPAHQADDIRELLHEVAREKGTPLGPNDDPIHDQDWYLTNDLRKRLKARGVDGFTLVQYEGDAVFIPAGAPHQVLNILDCIKVALDFVAPENLPECFNLTEEFRLLSKRHANHEDKLQIKNILFHTVKNLIVDLPDAI